MNLTKSITYLYTETPLHSEITNVLHSDEVERKSDAISLPVKREQGTKYPIILGSTIKGMARSSTEEYQLDKVNLLSGGILGKGGRLKSGKQPGHSKYNKTAMIGDAHILLFPVRSVNGTFAYITSSEILRQFAYSCQRSDDSYDQFPINWSLSEFVLESDTENPVALVTETSDVVFNENEVILEDLWFAAQTNHHVTSFARWLADRAFPQCDTKEEFGFWQKKLMRSLVILPHNYFDTLILYEIEVVERIRIKEGPTIKESSLWIEKWIPSDTLFYTSIYTTDLQRDSGLNIGDVLNCKPQEKAKMTTSSVDTTLEASLYLQIKKILEVNEKWIALSAKNDAASRETQEILYQTAGKVALHREEREALKEKWAIWKSFVEKESVSTIIGALLLLIITITLIVAAFTHVTIPQIIDNGFLVLLGYFFGQTVAKASSPDKKDD